MTLTALAAALAVVTTKTDVCELIATGDAKQVEAALGKGKLPTCGYPLAMQAVHKSKDDARTLAVLDVLVARGVKLDEKGAGGGNALWLSTGSVTKALLDKGVTCDAGGVEQQAAWSHIDSLTVLLAAGCPLGDALARSVGDPAIVKFLLTKGAKATAKNGQGETPLHAAVRYGNVDSARALLAAGAAVNAASNDGTTPMDLAVGLRDRALPMVQFLESKGGKVSDLDAAVAQAVYGYSSGVPEQLLKGKPTFTAKQGKAMHAAFERGDFSAVKLLIECGANPDVLDDTWGETPLMGALRAKSTGSAELVKYAKALDVQDPYGVTALMLAAEANDAAATKALLERGANQKLKSKEGKTALSIAEDVRSTEVIALLAPGSPSATAGVDALIWGGGTTPADGEKWLALFKAEQNNYARLVEFPAGYPKVVKSDDVPGMKPGFHVVLLGTCAGDEARHTLALFKGVAERVYARRVQVEAAQAACPTRVLDT
ncbi:MAG: ankyrin repeat domain-containing protein, partial [Myxococcaceae bacterium]|nr:ankyrin repeat domain-containing protein [Myxococcaceae bacterium]